MHNILSNGNGYWQTGTRITRTRRAKKTVTYNEDAIFKSMDPDFIPGDDDDKNKHLRRTYNKVARNRKNRKKKTGNQRKNRRKRQQNKNKKYRYASDDEFLPSDEGGEQDSESDNNEDEDSENEQENGPQHIPFTVKS